MNFNGFTQSDFATFAIEGLEARMKAIQERIQPKFKAIGETLCDDVALLAGSEMFLHIAKHARRTVNVPKDTWLAISHNKRGYKQHPHFQIGLFDDHVFIWLAFIYELPNKPTMAETFLQNLQHIDRIIPEHYAVSFDHTKKDAALWGTLTEDEKKKALERFRDIKKTELLIGRQISSEQPILQDGAKFIETAKETFETLMPLYKLAMN
jgi:uncharacterized protein YktB (UPF0637 family)